MTELSGTVAGRRALKVGIFLPKATLVLTVYSPETSAEEAFFLAEKF